MQRFVIIMSLLLLPSLTWAQSQPPLEQKATELERNLIAPCCWAKTLDQEQSEVAIYMKEKIRMQLAQGKSVEEIYAEFENEFGERVLAKPKASGFNWVVWIFPFLALLLGAFLLYRKLIVLKKPKPLIETGSPDEPTSVDKEPLSEDDQKYVDQIDKELYRK